MKWADLIAIRIYMCTFVANAQHLIKLAIAELGQYYANILCSGPQDVDQFVQKHFPGVLTAQEFNKFITFLKLLVMCHCAENMCAMRQYAVNSFEIKVRPKCEIYSMFMKNWDCHIWIMILNHSITLIKC